MNKKGKKALIKRARKDMEVSFFQDFYRNSELAKIPYESIIECRNSFDVCIKKSTKEMISCVNDAKKYFLEVYEDNDTEYHYEETEIFEEFFKVLRKNFNKKIGKREFLRPRKKSKERESDEDSKMRIAAALQVADETFEKVNFSKITDGKRQDLSNDFIKESKVAIDFSSMKPSNFSDEFNEKIEERYSQIKRDNA